MKKITSKTATLAKKKGYSDNSSLYEYYDKYYKCWFTTNAKGGISGKENTVQRPTQSVLQKWLRDKHSIYIDIITETSVNEILGFHVKLKSWKFPPRYIDIYQSYEKALEYGLRESLKLIK